MTLSRLLGVAFACTISLTSTSSFAAPPSSEELCNDLLGFTPSLYGLCVAYWETAEVTPNLDEPPANAKILEKYREKKKEGDPDMPGLATDSGCPCWSVEEFNSIVEEGGVGDGFEPDNCSGQDTGFSKFLQIEDSYTTDHQTHMAGAVVIGSDAPRCYYVDSVNPSKFLDTTAEEANTCYDQIISACTAWNL